MKVNLPALPLDALEALAASGDAPSLFAGTPVLSVALEGTAAPSALLQQWLQQIACPVIGLGSGSAPLAADCDVVVADAAAASPLLAQIEATPRAAAVAMQVLRQVQGLALAPALMIESLAYATLQAGPEYQAWLAQQRQASPVASDSGPAVVVAETPEGWHLRLNRSSTRNAMSVEMRDALLTALTQVAADSHAKPITLSGEGACFSTGGELGEFGSTPDPASGHLIRTLALPGRALAAVADRCTAVLHGACIGSGIEFPAFASRVEARSGAWFQLPELRMGLIPGAGGCVSISRRIGRQRTAWMLLSGRRITAQTALEWRLIDALIH